MKHHLSEKGFSGHVGCVLYVCAMLEKTKHYMGATFQQTVYRSVYLTFRLAGTMWAGEHVSFPDSTSSCTPDQTAEGDL